MEDQLKDMLKDTKRSIICFLFGVILPIMAWGQEEKELRPLLDRILDTTAIHQADTIFIYGKFCSSCITGSMESIYVLYKKQGKSFFIYASKRNDKEDFDVYNHQTVNNDLITSIFTKNKEDILQFISNDIDLSEKQECNNKVISWEPLNHGIKLVYRIQVLNEVYAKEICCGIYINELYSKFPELWEFTSALVNERKY